MKKKLFLWALSLFVLIPCTVLAESKYVNYYDIEISEKEYNNLLELGFSESEIYHMSEEEFNKNKDIEGKLEADTTNYYASIIRRDVTGKIVSSSDMQISEEDYMNGNIVVPYSDGYIEVTTRSIRTTIAKASSKYRYKAYVSWKEMPSVRSYDIIGIGINPEVYVSSSLSFSQTYCVMSVCQTNTATNSTLINPSGAGVSFKMNDTKTLTKFESTLYFDVSKSGSGTLKSMAAYGDYAHAIKTISGGSAQGFLVDQSGIYLDSGIRSYYDEVQKATAQWSGTW